MYDNMTSRTIILTRIFSKIYYQKQITEILQKVTMLIFKDNDLIDNSLILTNYSEGGFF